MINNEKKERINDLLGYKATCAKDDLINIMSELEDLGAIRKARSLGTIIEKLERWQHTR